MSCKFSQIKGLIGGNKAICHISTIPFACDGMPEDKVECPFWNGQIKKIDYIRKVK